MIFKQLSNDLDFYLFIYSFIYSYTFSKLCIFGQSWWESG